MTELYVLGWREWASLPDLGIKAIKVKVDTGAKTSSIHTFKMEFFQKNDEDWVRFWIHPKQRNEKDIHVCEAKIVDRRSVSDSGGHVEERIVIETHIRIGETLWPIELNLTNRDSMKFRMLLGRTAMVSRFVVNPALSYQRGGRPS